MSAMVLPDGSVLEVFGSGGGQVVAERISTLTGTKVPLLGSIPLDPNLRANGDAGRPIVLADPDSHTSQAIMQVADKLVVRKESLTGKSLKCARASLPASTTTGRTRSHVRRTFQRRSPRAL